MAIKDIRLENLKSILKVGGYSQTELAMKCDLSPSLISQVMTKHRNMGTALARKLEGKLQLQEGWFDIPHGLLETVDLISRKKRERPIIPTELDLSRREIRLVELFRQMPESEKDNIINGLSDKKRQYDKLLDELIAVKSELMLTSDSDNTNENSE